MQALAGFVLQNLGPLLLGKPDGDAERNVCLALKGTGWTSQQFAVKSMQFGTVEMLAGRLGQRQALRDRRQRLGIVTSLQVCIC